MNNGDSRAAVLVSVHPVRVAAYSDHLDGVVILRFPDDVFDSAPKVGDRLLTVNTYGRRAQFDRDLIVGPGYRGVWTHLYPIIADFICADSARVEARKAAIDEAEWELTARLGAEYLRARPGMSRDGAPTKSMTPAPRLPFHDIQGP